MLSSLLFDFSSKIGVLLLQEPPYDDYNGHLDCLKSINKPYRLFSGKELNEEFPGVQFEDHYKGMLELDGGSLLANKCLQCYQVVWLIKIFHVW